MNKRIQYRTSQKRLSSLTQSELAVCRNVHLHVREAQIHAFIIHGDTSFNTWTSVKGRPCLQCYVKVGFLRSWCAFLLVCFSQNNRTAVNFNMRAMVSLADSVSVDAQTRVSLTQINEVDLSRLR